MFYLPFFVNTVAGICTEEIAFFYTFRQLFQPTWDQVLGKKANQKLIGWEGISPLSADYNVSMLAVKVSSVNGVTALVFLHSTYVSNSL